MFDEVLQSLHAGGHTAPVPSVEPVHEVEDDVGGDADDRHTRAAHDVVGVADVAEWDDLHRVVGGVSELGYDYFDDFRDLDASLA